MPHFPIDPERTIREILAEAPETRRVFDRYGLLGCGGPQGPVESVAFFARAHDIDLGELLGELERCRSAEGGEPPSDPASATRADEDLLWRRFFKGGILVTLTAGATWGAFLLARIALSGSFTTSVSIAEINAHGYAQIFGWLGLFVMGFAYQAFPRFRRTRLAHPQLAAATLPVMLAGILLRSSSEPFARSSGIAFVLAVAGSSLVLAAVGGFAVVILQTIARSRRASHPADLYLVAGTCWFVLGGLGEILHLLNTVLAPSASALVRIVADWQVPLRDVQLHGFALMMVLGVSLRLLPGFFGTEDVPRATVRRSWAALNLALVAEVVGYLALRGGHGSGKLLMAFGWIGLLGGCALLAVRMGVWRRVDRPDRSLKFVRAAYVWLVGSFAMLAATPFYFAVSGRDFSHAWLGATRHAITVGFFSMMILGISSRVAPILRGIDPQTLSPLAYPFLLLNLGCGMRVIFQVLTDFSPQAYPVMGISSLLEVSALIAWAVPLWRAMDRPAQEEKAGAAFTGHLTGAETVDLVLASRRGALDLLVSHGFHALESAPLRALMARRIRLEDACRMHGVELDPLLAGLNALTPVRPDRTASTRETVGRSRLHVLHG